MLIIPSKELLLISAQQTKEIFLFDPKTSSVITKYHCDSSLSKALAYYPQSNQFVTSFTNKTFVNIWSSDNQQPINKVSTLDIITYLTISSDNNILYAGSQNGNIFIWQLPSGILIKKLSIHSSEVKIIKEFIKGYIITVSQQQVKIWSLSSFFIETQRSTPIKTIPSILQIIDVQCIRNIIVIITSKSVTYYTGGNQSNPFLLLKKQDIQYPTKICSSKSHIYISDFQGLIHGQQIIENQNDYGLDFQYNEDNHEIQIKKSNKKFILKSSNKYPITTLIYLNVLQYLISGNVEGEIFIWQNHTLKKSLKLFKTSIKFIHTIPRSNDDKIPQNLKIRPLAKFQQNKETQPLEIDLSKLQVERNHIDNGFNFVQSTEKIRQQNENEQILKNMLEVLTNPQDILQQRIQQLQTQKQLLINANLHYCQLWNQSN